MSIPSLAALQTLLSDDDAVSVGLVRESLLGAGVEALPVLRELLGSDDARVTRRVREVIESIERADALRAFDELCARPDEFDLEASVWALSRVFDPGVEVGRYRARLDEWAEDAREGVGAAWDAEGRVLALAACLVDRHGLRGNAEDYYSPANSLLTSVVDSRFGNPISLCVIHMLVAERIGMKVAGVNLPGHFIARHEHVHFDPFHGGRILGVDDLRGILARQGAEPSPAYFQPAGTLAILLRMLGNLERIFRGSGDAPHADMLAGWARVLGGGGA